MGKEKHNMIASPGCLCNGTGIKTWDSLDIQNNGSHESRIKLT
jgi:hypothetical protein